MSKNGKNSAMKSVVGYSKWILIAVIFNLATSILMGLITMYIVSTNTVETVIVTYEERPAKTDTDVEIEEVYIPVYTEEDSKESEKYLWDKISEFSPSDHITAAVLGYFKRESEFRSDAVAGWHTAYRVHGVDHCDIFTQAIDEGLTDGSSRERFVNECKYKYGGYGLGQWSSVSYCDALYSFAQEQGKSIGDADMQCEFAILSMMDDDILWPMLMGTESPYKAGMLIANLYDGTSEVEYMANLACYYYDIYAEKE